MRCLLALLVVCNLSAAAVAQSFTGSGSCASGRCPLDTTPATPVTAPESDLKVDARAIARISNQRGSVRAAGSGTLVAVDGERGLVITCAHLFREGAGAIAVTFPRHEPLAARLEQIDEGADLAALSIPAPDVEPVAIAERYPRRGDPLVSCGYGGDGRLWCNRGQALGYVTTVGSQGVETLEMSGTARLGDSGGPMFDKDHRLVAVLFGTNGRVVDGTYCGRVRRFLAGLMARLRPRETNPLAASPAVTSPPAQNPPSTSPPTVPPASTEPQPDRLAKLEQLLARFQHGWQAIGAKVDALAQAAEARQAADAANKSDQASPQDQAESDLPGGASESKTIGDEFEKVIEPWATARVAALLVSWGVPGGIAGAAAGAVVWLVMRRAKARLQNQLDRTRSGAASAGPADTSVASDTAPDASVVERHHNQYVPYEVTALDKAWAAAHAHVGERYPGAVPYLKLVEGVKDQLISGNNDPQLS